jgi:hypothetical protein
MLITLAVPPTVSDMEPERTSLVALAMGLRVPLDVELLV